MPLADRDERTGRAVVAIVILTWTVRATGVLRLGSVRVNQAGTNDLTVSVSSAIVTAGTVI